MKIMGFFTKKRILIIGGTGTIGRGLIKEIIAQKPDVIRILSRDEYKQFMMIEELSSQKNFLRFLIGDVRDYDRVERAMEGVDIVFNLAAMKHVTSCQYNPSEAIKTNVTGMENVIKAAISHNVECVLFTSSDKAINPANTYGATKLLAEKLVQAANFSKGNVRTRFIAVRFGNVMGSRGSVIPLFRKQIEEEMRISITDPSMTRFMMSLTQAVRLIMNTCEKSYGGEAYILKMPVIRLSDLAEVIVEDYCKKMRIKKEHIKIDKIGLRAGERKFEELMTLEESEFAYDMGEMYTVIPMEYKEELSKYYENLPKAQTGSYNSNEIEVLAKEDVKSLLKQEGLL